ncbi:larval cuticle protein LCP-17-like [Zerene cesonia]|uniref:larval cuticle protein LCP-17-like n=1 Tax=Zerene cesonia TaxID=33412 RepID=UPI0018E59220|nr:larval cuticle protein LCP-17-like [Zerene cesonia]
MKFIVVLAVFVAWASADVSHVASPDYIVPIVRSSFESNPDGSSFNYAYETGNGIISQTDGVVKNPNTEDASLEVKGNVRYTAPDGTPVEFTYVANKEGFQPVGSHVPQIPELILRAQQYIASHPPQVKKA